ncbi:MULTISPECIES: pentapeptide repeat-containing protein [Kamptonema]|uniref:pentapeptide repeat-containing protein n=1 Tax=Kamptonema TaxID=1501433 RepID=UPI0001DAC91C|nr:MULTISPECIES: pentapeptide repeat-containing protein [Kamptonema]CBN54403.1 conserved hypothetical protein [Kamptonema sp. PCC 6506]
MSQEELDLSSLNARVLQLEENQVILKRYIAKLKQRLEAHEQLFNERYEARQLESLMAEVAILQQRFNLENGEQAIIPEPPIEVDSQAEEFDFQYQLVCDRLNSRAVLMEALSIAQERVIIVCPWLNCNSINDELLQKFRECLNRGCLIDIGWGYLGDRQNIGKGWRYNALADLQELASEYPDRFCLDLLGTHENFLVCDSSFAMLGSHNLLTNGDQSAEREVGIRTNDSHIIKQLIERFDSSEVLSEDEIERRFVASSDYLDRADYLEGLAADTEDIALEDSCEDVEDESEECLEPVVSVEEFWKRYKQGERDFAGINLAGADLRTKNLANVNLSNANLNKANLIGVSWQYVNLSGANLKGADMRDASFPGGTNFSEANLCGVNLSNGNLQSAKLEKAKLRKASLRGARLEYANFTEADLNGANLSGAKLSIGTKFSDASLVQANLSGLYLRKVDLRNTDLTNANLSNANLLEANFDGANLNGVELQGAICNEATLFPIDFDPVKAGAYLLVPYGSLQNANITDRDLTNIKLMGADLQGANLSSVRFSGSDLRDANLSGAKLQGVNLESTNLSRANLRQVNLSDAKLNSANLTTADLTEADLRQVSLNYAKLGGADLISADLRAANLSCADLSGANLTDAKIGGANFENAKLTGTIMPDGSTHE